MARKSNINREKIFTVAIVGEGITEWHYFNDLRRVEKYKFAIKPQLPDNKTDFSSLINKAKKLIYEEYDLVYCVVDLDYIISDQTNKKKYYKMKIEVEKKYKNISIIETMPCIEFWFLLHFYKTYSTRTYENYNSLKKELKKYLTDYDKSEKYFRRVKIYQTLKKSNKLDKAIEYAEKLLIDKTKSDNDLFSYTDIQSLLLDLKKQNRKNSQ